MTAQLPTHQPEGGGMSTTPTGIPIIECSECGWSHPSNRVHCDRCGKASAFIDPHHRLCLNCSQGVYGGILP